VILTGSEKKGDGEEPFQDEEDFIDEEVWDAVEWDNMGPIESDAVFDKDMLSDILKEAVDKAWDDGIITNDEMAILQVLKKKLSIDDDTFDWIINERKPDEIQEAKEVSEEEEEMEIEEEDEEGFREAEEISDEDIMEIDDEDEDTDKSIVVVEKEERDEVIKGEILNEPVQYFRKEELDLSQQRPDPLKPDMAPPPKPPEMITLRHSVRGEARPLDQAFDLTKKKESTGKITRRCPHCRSLIRLDPEHGKTTCPVCGKKVSEDDEQQSPPREALDAAKAAYKGGDVKTARSLYGEILQKDPGNKEAQFYLQKMKAKKSTPGASAVDSRNISFIDTTSNRMDQLLGGGVKMGDTMLVEGPPFCGKEILLEQLLASSLRKGVPVIYVSTNRAMKEVMRSIIRRVPDFKEFNHRGMIRMYDLFSKFKDDKVMKEGHRIFNIEDREDFMRFQDDLVFAQEELVKIYHGGILIINSLSPLISQVDQLDLMKFLQVLIARSKSYRFTNILDMAAGVHAESVINSVEYLMDGIIEFREHEMKNMCRLKGFSQNIMTRDWVEYMVKDDRIHIVGSFMEERIV
jgi:KaiC/GvpD/RAD55 family RecA-like ATPase